MPALRPLVSPGHSLRTALAGAALAAGLSAACSSPIAPPPPPDAPSLNCPTGVSQTSSDGRPVTVAYTTPTAIGGAAPVSVSCAPASGTTFAVGATAVNCTATDSLARQGTCSFTVMVTSTVRLQHTRFVAFGDSLTEGKLSRIVSVLVEFPTSYTSDLQALLRSKYTSQSPVVINEGKGGENTSDGLNIRLPEVMAKDAPVEVLLLMHGANDLNNVNGNLAIDAAVENVRQMIRTAQGLGSVVFLATLPPQASPAAGRTFIPEYNQKLRTVAASTNAHLVDLYAGFNGVPMVGADGLHLTEAGYDKIANLFFETIQARLEVKGP
jgi:lysophospholipase L1-like esterase